MDTLTEAKEIIGHTLDKFEGHKYTNYASDRGGPTKYGITIPAYKAFFGGHVNAETIKNMTRYQAIQIYEANYYNKAKIGRYPPRLRHLVYDMGVHHGRKRPVKMIQALLNQEGLKKLKVDGVMGPNTLRNINEMPPYRLYEALIDKRIEFMRAIVKRDKSQKKYIKGWLNRANWFKGKRVNFKKIQATPQARAKISERRGPKIDTAIKLNTGERGVIPTVKKSMSAILRLRIPFMILLLVGCTSTALRNQLGDDAAALVVRRGDSYCEIAKPIRDEFRQQIIDAARYSPDGLFVEEIIVCKQDLPEE